MCQWCDVLEKPTKATELNLAHCHIGIIGNTAKLEPGSPES
jgi:hypothetical protein